VTDARSNPPRFLEDVEKGKLHYYFLDEHSEDRALQRKGKIRRSFPRSGFFTKRSVRVEMTAETPEDREVIEEFNASGSENGITRAIGSKRRQEVIPARGESRDAAKVMDELGLRESSSRIKDNGDRQGSDSPGDGRKPLSISPSDGGGERRAARIDVVRARDFDFLAYESIHARHTGDSNVFVSPKTPSRGGGIRGRLLHRHRRKGARARG